MKSQSTWIYSLIALSTLGCNWCVWAGAFRLPDQDAFATSRGEAFAATADNPSAIYYNPAGITQLEGNQLRGGIYGIWFQSSFDAPAGSEYTTDAKINPVPQLFYTFSPTNLPLAFGLGMYSPYGLSQQWPEDTGFRTLAIEGSLTYFTANPVVAWKVVPTLSVAAGLTLNYAKLDQLQGISPVPDSDGFRFEGSGFDPGFNVGLLWQFHPNFTIGVNYRSETQIDYSGETEITGIVPGSVNTDAEASFIFPQNIVVGVSWRPTTNWNLEVNLDWTDWDRVNSVTIEQDAPPLGVFPQNITQVLNWRSSFYYEFGITRYIDNKWAISAGFIYNEDSIPDETYSPLIADVDKYFVSLGGSYQKDHLRVSLAYQFGIGPSRNVTGSAPSAAGQTADGSYDFLSQAVLLSAGWDF